MSQKPPLSEPRTRDEMVLHFPRGLVPVWFSLLWPFSGGFRSRFKIPNMYGVVALIRATLTRGIGGKLLSNFAISKHAKLLTDASYVRKQLLLLVRDEHVDRALVVKALERLADPISAAAVRRTIEVLCLTLRPIDPSALTSVKRKVVLAERGRAAAYRQRGFDAIEIDDSKSAIMLDAPQAVADTLRTVAPASKGTLRPGSVA